MKKVFILLIALLMMSSVSFAQENETDDIFFVGGKWNEGPFGTFGTGQNVFGNVWILESTDFGKVQTANIDVAYIFTPGILAQKTGFSFFNNVRLGVFSGPIVDWLNTETNDDLETIAYAALSTGGLVGYEFNEYGITGYYKRKVALDSENGYFSNNVGGLIGYIKF